MDFGLKAKETARILSNCCFRPFDVETSGFHATAFIFTVYLAINSSASIGTGYDLESQGSIFGTDKRLFSTPHCPDRLWGPNQPPVH
jgi:hypothetical protein